MAKADRVDVVRRCLVCFHQGDGVSYTDLSREANQDFIKVSCKHDGWGDNNSDAGTQAIRDSIKTESETSGVPTELILAVMMQESKGCVRAPTSQSDAHNPGLMQGAGTASCHSLAQGPVSPCPTSKIRDMIHEGTAGQGLRTSLKESLDAFSTTTDDSKYYKAARRYNSGSQVTNPNLGHSATACYASDIAKPSNQAFRGEQLRQQCYRWTYQDRGPRVLRERRRPENRPRSTSDRQQTTSSKRTRR